MVASDGGGGEEVEDDDVVVSRLTRLLGRSFVVAVLSSLGVGAAVLDLVETMLYCRSIEKRQKERIERLALNFDLSFALPMFFVCFPRLTMLKKRISGEQKMFCSARGLSIKELQQQEFGNEKRRKRNR